MDKKKRKDRKERKRKPGPQREPQPGVVRSLSADETLIRKEDSIAGQLAILVESKDSHLAAIPLRLYNRNEMVVLGIERSRPGILWGAKFGHWAQTYEDESDGSEYPLGFSKLLSMEKLFVSQFLVHPDHTNPLRHRKRHKVYLIRNALGDLVFAAKERINFKIRHSSGRSSQIDLRLFDAFKRETLFCRQHLKFGSALSPCCLQYMQVMAQPSKPIGTVRQTPVLFGSGFKVMDEKKKHLFTLRSTTTGFWSRSQIFDIYSVASKAVVGRIKPSLIGDNVGQSHELPILSIEFKQYLNPINKCQLIAALFLIKFLYYD